MQSMLFRAAPQRAPIPIRLRAAAVGVARLWPDRGRTRDALTPGPRSARTNDGRKLAWSPLGVPGAILGSPLRAVAGLERSTGVPLRGALP